MIVTQPRRVAATSIADRVANQLSKDNRVLQGLKNIRPRVNYGLGGLVGYRVRFDERRSTQTRITFATDGLLIRECLMGAPSGPASLFNKYEYVIIDEAHERSVRIDQLLGLCQLALLARKNESVTASPLKLIIMSATMDLDAIMSFYRQAKLSVTHMHIEGRTFPVTHLYTKNPVEDYIDACANAVCQIVTSTSQGDILVFLPGSDEILSLKRLLLEKLGTFQHFQKTLKFIQRVLNALKSDKDLRNAVLGTPVNSLGSLLFDHFGVTHEDISPSEVENMAEHLRGLALDPSIEVEVEAMTWITPQSVHGGTRAPLSTDVLEQVLELYPLYAALSFQEQQKVFEPAPSDRHRKLIISTNIAETSLTLPGVKYVVDSGKVKLKVGATLKTVDVSSAMAKQRSGRAGRVAEGTTYRIMPQSSFRALAPHTDPEIMRSELADIILDFTAMNGLLETVAGRPTCAINDWPLPTPPPADAVTEGLALLRALGALTPDGLRLTEKG